MLKGHIFSCTKKLRGIACLFYFIFFVTSLPSQGVIVNEMSNGAAGNQEYIELVAIGPGGFENCATVDLRGFIVDDNNGDFSGGPIAGAGIAPGHIRFSVNGPWSAIPAGSLLLIYNTSDKNTSIILPDDPYDANNDSIYIIPDSCIHIERCNPIPNSNNDTYSPAAYNTTAVWANQVGMRNAGDASQVRNPDGTYFHGFGYGNPPITGGPDNILLTGGGTNRVIHFLNTVDDNYRNVANFAKNNISGNETPGSANNLRNQTWIDWLKANCGPLDANTYGKLNAKFSDKGISIEWENASIPGDYCIEKLNGIFESFTCGFFPSLSEEYPTPLFFLDDKPSEGNNYYRGLFTGINGNTFVSETSSIFWENQSTPSIFPNPASSYFHIRNCDSGQILLYNSSGSKVFEADIHSEGEKINLSQFPDGIYSLKLHSHEKISGLKVIIAR